jgi:hypothetical protein
MGWFDVKSWKMRRKIKDLQADLRAAEREGKYLVEQGLFFAELEDMGEATMMVFGAVDTLAAQEETVITQFLDRNGFTADSLKLDSSGHGMTTVEIIPPEEITRAVARALKEAGFRMIDDSEREIPFDPEAHIFPLSSLVRGIAVLFCEKANTIIATSRIKFNKEGNRLLHWLPKMAEALRNKMDERAVAAAHDAFEEAYAVHYLRMAAGGEGVHALTPHPPVSAQPPKDLKPSDKIPGLSFAPASPAASPTAPTPGPQPAAPGQISPAPDPLNIVAPPAAAEPKAAAPSRTAPAREVEAQATLARLYKSLIKANSSRCVRNCEALLAEINTFFAASATCLMAKVADGSGLTIYAQSGTKLVWGEGATGGFPISASILGDAVRKREVVTSNAINSSDPTASMLAHDIDTTAAAPIVVNDEVVALLYLDRRANDRRFGDADATHLALFARVFEEFPDLTIGLA